jgi:hypothetical protein
MLENLFDALRGIPRLPGALCAGQADLFDNVELPDDAIQLCRRCPALAACSAWVESLDEHALSGVVAGRLFVWASHPTVRRREAATA